MPPLEPNTSIPDKRNQAQTLPDPEGTVQETNAPEFVTLEKRSWVLTDLLRVLLLVLSLAVAEALILVILPQSTVDGIVSNLQARHSVSSPEPIAFLYLSDETVDNEFHIRGVVRNISAMPIEQLDVIVRLYAHDRSLSESTVVRMSKETIDPGGIAQFELVYPNYQLQFGSYSVEFKLRQGAIVPYKDMRTMRPRSD